MSTRRLLLASLLIALVGGLGYFTWRWYTTPTVPEVFIDPTDIPFVEAVEQAQAEVRRLPRSGKAWGKLGMVLGANGLGKEARECYLNAQRFDPTDPRWSYLLAIGLRQANRPDEAIVLFRRSLAVEQASHHRPTALFQLSLALIDDGKLDEAETELAELAALGPDAPQCRYLQGLIALARGDRVELRGFGAFSVKHRPARTGRNPRTGAHVAVEQKSVPFFKTGKEMRERLNRPIA